MMRTGKSYVLGRHADGDFAMWDHTVSHPVERYPAGEFAYAKANRDLDTAENIPLSLGAAQPAAARGRSGMTALIVLVLLFAGIYLWVHAHRYSGCVFSPPGIFEWP